MGRKPTRIKPGFLRGGDWHEFELRYPEAARFLQLCSLTNELQQTETDIKTLRGVKNIDHHIERRLEIIQDLTDQAKSPDRWNYKFL